MRREGGQGCKGRCGVRQVSLSGGKVRREREGWKVRGVGERE